MKLQEYGASYHLVELHSTVLSAEPLTVRPVTVFHSHEVFTLQCSTSVCHSPAASVNTVYYFIQQPLSYPFQTFEVHCNKAQYE